MSDLKRCREAFEKIYPEDSGDRFDRVLYDKWLMFKAGWYAARADNDWRPIDIAPRDGTRLLMCFAPVYDPFTGWFNGKEWVAMAEFESDDPIPAGPTHWRPLPDPPRKDDGHEITDEEGGGVR